MTSWRPAKIIMDIIILKILYKIDKILTFIVPNIFGIRQSVFLKNIISQ